MYQSFREKYFWKRTKSEKSSKTTQMENFSISIHTSHSRLEHVKIIESMNRKGLEKGYKFE